MRCRGKIGRGVTLALIAAATLATATSPAEAEEPLRWKFTPGQKLNYNMVQDMTMSAGGGPLGQMNTTMRQEMDMVWDVQGVNEEGEAVILQKFGRVKMKMAGPLGGFEYDSKSDTAPAGMAAMIAPMYKAMTEGEFEITMTSRGEVKDVKIPEEVLTALKNSPGAAAMGEMATADGFKKMISQGALVLPEKMPAPGEQWSSKIEMNNPTAGKQTVETSYRYEGMKEIDGVSYAVFRPSLKMAFEGSETMQMKITEQDSSGEILFNPEAGRLHSSTLKQNVTIDVTTGSQAMQQKIGQTIAVKVTPAEAEGQEPSGESQEPEAAAK